MGWVHSTLFKRFLKLTIRRLGTALLLWLWLVNFTNLFVCVAVSIYFDIIKFVFNCLSFFL